MLLVLRRPSNILVAALKKLGFTTLSLHLTMCGDNEFPSNPLDRRLCSDLAAMGADQARWAAEQNKAQAERNRAAAERNRAAAERERAAAERERAVQEEKLAKQEAWNRERAEAWRVADEKYKRESQESLQRLRLGIGAIVIASAAVFAALMVKRRQLRRRTVRSW